MQEQQTVNAIGRAARALVASDYAIALVGAGMSVESGIPPFRGPNGLWTRYGEPPMNGYQLFMDDPVAWWQDILNPQGWRVELDRAIAAAAPNPGHYALADLERMGVLRCLITQNVDDLHGAAGQRSLLEIHGNRTKLRCVGCGWRVPRGEFSVDPANLPPRCPECGAIVKSDTVMFGEPIPSEVLQRCYEEAERADCILVVGTSATVYPAASFPEVVKRRGGTLIEVNAYETDLSPFCDVVLWGPSGALLPQVVDRVREARA